MSTFYGVTESSGSSLFSSLNTTKTTNSTDLSALTSLVSDYESIRSGSYQKLLDKYYASQDTDSSTSLSTSSDSSKKLMSIKSSGEDLKESVEGLVESGTDSLFKEGDSEKIYSAISDFVDSYNSLIDSTATSNTKSIASNTQSMITTTETNSALLQSIGISVNSDFTLSLDEDKLKNASMSTVKSLFNGAGSYGYQTGVKASMIVYNADTEISKSGTYTSSGSYSSTYSTGSIYDSLN